MTLNTMLAPRGMLKLLLAFLAAQFHYRPIILLRNTKKEPKPMISKARNGHDVMHTCKPQVYKPPAQQTKHKRAITSAIISVFFMVSHLRKISNLVPQNHLYVSTERHFIVQGFLLKLLLKLRRCIKYNARFIIVLH